MQRSHLFLVICPFSLFRRSVSYLSLLQFAAFCSSFLFIFYSYINHSLALYSSIPLFFSLASFRNPSFSFHLYFNNNRQIKSFTYFLLFASSLYFIAYSLLSYIFPAIGFYSAEGDFLLPGINNQIWSTKYILMSSLILLVCGFHTTFNHRIIISYFFGCSLILLVFTGPFACFFDNYIYLLFLFLLCSI